MRDLDVRNVSNTVSPSQMTLTIRAAAAPAHREEAKSGGGTRTRSVGVRAERCRGGPRHAVRPSPLPGGKRLARARRRRTRHVSIMANPPQRRSQGDSRSAYRGTRRSPGCDEDPGGGSCGSATTRPLAKPRCGRSPRGGVLHAGCPALLAGRAVALSGVGHGVAPRPVPVAIPVPARTPPADAGPPPTRGCGSRRQRRRNRHR